MTPEAVIKAYQATLSRRLRNNVELSVTRMTGRSPEWWYEINPGYVSKDWTIGAATLEELSAEIKERMLGKLAENPAKAKEQR